MEKELSESYNNNELHNYIINEIKNLIEKMPEFNVTPFYKCDSEKEKAFSVIADNGHGNIMKRFTIVVKDLKRVE